MTEAPISPVQYTRPELRIESAAINNEPVELDGTPTSPDKIKALKSSSRPAEQSAARNVNETERKVCNNGLSLSLASCVFGISHNLTLANLRPAGTRRAHLVQKGRPSSLSRPATNAASRRTRYCWCRRCKYITIVVMPLLSNEFATSPYSTELPVCLFQSVLSSFWYFMIVF